MVELADGGLDWRIATGGLLCNPPFLRGGERERGGLDFEVERRQEEVQKEREIAEDWTLKRRRGKRKSKKSEKEWQIGL